MLYKWLYVITAWPKPFPELRFHRDIVLNSLCFAGRWVFGVILLHNPYDEREEKNGGEDTGRWQKSANSYSPNNYPAAFSILNKACKTLITPTGVQYANRGKTSKSENIELLPNECTLEDVWELLEYRPNKDLGNSTCAIFLRWKSAKTWPVVFSSATAKQRQDQAPPGSFAECALHVKCAILSW